MNESDCLFSFNQRAASENIEDFPSSLRALFQGADCGSLRRATRHLCSNTLPFFMSSPTPFTSSTFHTRTLTSVVQNGVRGVPPRFVSHFSEANSTNNCSQFGSGWRKSCTCSRWRPRQVGPPLRWGFRVQEVGREDEERVPKDTVGTAGKEVKEACTTAF